VLVTNKQFIC